MRMMIERRVLEGEHVRLEPVGGEHREELREALNVDPGTWEIYGSSAYGEHYAGFWDKLTGTPDRIGFAVRDRASGRIAGTSSFLKIEPDHRTLEIGFTFFRPEYRGTYVNPEAKLLMLGEAFGAGALRVQFSVDTRNERSQAAVAKLGAVREGIVRRHLITWTGHKRDTALFSIIEEEWGAVKEQLRRRLRLQSKP
jgi:RimJ/RimL family protein N-acetyltransferase